MPEITQKLNVRDYRKKCEEVIEIPFLYPSENQILVMHPMKRKREHDRFQQNAGTFFNARHIKPFTRPVKILIDLCFMKKRRRDNDNYGGKWLLDAIVKAGILPDDSNLWIPDSPDVLILYKKPV